MKTNLTGERTALKFLVEAYRDGNETVLEELVKRCSEVSSSTIYRMLSQKKFHADRDDVNQRVLWKIVRGIPDLVATDEPVIVAWITKVTVRECIDYFRKKNQEARHRVDYLVHETTLESRDSTDGDLEIEAFVSWIDDPVVREMARMRVAGEDWKTVQSELNLSRKRCDKLRTRLEFLYRKWQGDVGSQTSEGTSEHD